MSPFLIFLVGNSSFINLLDKTKFMYVFLYTFLSATLISSGHSSKISATVLLLVVFIIRSMLLLGHLWEAWYLWMLLLCFQIALEGESYQSSIDESVNRSRDELVMNWCTV